jgi:hypothetical protein
MRALRRLHPPVSFLVQPTNQSPLGFEAQTKKSLWWFWCPNHKTVVAGFDAQTGKPATTNFEVKPGETVLVVLMPNHWQTVIVILRLNHWQTVPVVLRPNH